MVGRARTSGIARIVKVLKGFNIGQVFYDLEFMVGGGAELISDLTDICRAELKALGGIYPDGIEELTADKFTPGYIIIW